MQAPPPPPPPPPPPHPEQKKKRKKEKKWGREGMCNLFRACLYFEEDILNQNR